MNGGSTYHIVDEPRPSKLQKFAMPPLLVFIIGNLFLPWGWTLIGANAVLSNGPSRNLEIAYVLISIGIYFLGIMLLNAVINVGFLNLELGRYAFSFVIGGALILIAKAYVSQAETANLRKYLRQG